MKFISPLIILILSIYSCNSTPKIEIGGTINVYESETYRSLFPHNAIDAIGIKVVNQVFEGLVKFDEKTLERIPALAASWTVTNENKRYTFKLREDVYFHSDNIYKNKEERRMTADDVIYSFNKLCTFDENNSGFHSTFKDLVVGANEHYIYSVDPNFNEDIKGIKKIDDFTIQIDLLHSSPYFLYTLSLPYCNVFSKKSFETYNEDSKIGTGPFQITKANHDLVELIKNKDYYMKDHLGNSLPYLDGINFHFSKEVNDQVVAFQNGEIDALYKMNEKNLIKRTKELDVKNKVDHKHLTTPYMAVSYCAFNMRDSILSNKKVRQAINYAIDVAEIRNAIDPESDEEVTEVAGITPPVFEKYSTKRFKTYALDVEKAKALLEEAGYPNGEGIHQIELDINKGRGNNAIIASEIKRQLKERLNIDVKVNIMSFGEKIDKSRSGKSQFFKAAWIADYPHPSNFLSLFYGRDIPNSDYENSYPNSSRYKNPQFDYLYEKANHVPIEETYIHLERAEKILMEEAPMIVLWYGKNQVLLNDHVHNYPMNVMGYINFARVWKDKN